MGLVVHAVSAVHTLCWVPAWQFRGATVWSAIAQVSMNATVCRAWPSDRHIACSTVWLGRRHHVRCIGTVHLAAEPPSGGL